MGSEGTLEGARRAFAASSWREAGRLYASIAGTEALPLDDIERYAIAAHLAGDEEESREALARGYRAAIDRADVTRAVRFAFYHGHSMIFTGEMGQANGWFTRAHNLLAERGVDCVEWGYLLIPTAIQRMMDGDAHAAHATFEEAHGIGRRFADPTLIAAAGHGRGRALIQMGRTDEGMAALDEVMVAVASKEVSPLLVGNIYCGVLEACQEMFDLQRAREWTAVFSRWCEEQTDLVPYRGPCLVHRVELMRLRGDWEDAIEEAQRACAWLSLPSSPEGPADAFYQLGELQRLRANFAEAEEAYRQASRFGRAPEPGLPLLWLARGQANAAATAMRRALNEPGGEHPLGERDRALINARRAEMLSAYVEILLALGDGAEAQRVAEELATIAQALGALLLKALADRAMGSVLVAAGEPLAALAPLRRSWSAWKRLDVPYEGARVRVLLATACRSLGDEESAAMEADAARWVFERLGAACDVAKLDAQFATALSPEAHALTAREMDVLELIARGETNKSIAATLVISEHTVARHVQNMLGKLGVSSRAALAALAVERGLARRSHSQN